MTTKFPDSMDFAGYNAPSRIECDVRDLIVEGEVPAEINGSWYRSIPDPQYPPKLGYDTYLSGDGMVSLFRFENGHVDFKQRYILTERLKADRAARRSLFGRYRNPFTDDPSVRDVVRCANNTTPIWHGGKLLTLKEDGLPVEVHPDTLETVGIWNYDGKLRSQTMTAHTRLDPQTGELFFFGYEAGGLASPEVSFCIADKRGNLVQEEWFTAPYCSWMHDFVVTKDYIFFPIFPATADVQRMKAGGSHWIYEPDKEAFFGVMPRGGSVKDMRWFRRPACFSFHFMNAHSEGGRLHIDFGVGSMHPFPFVREDSGIHIPPDQLDSKYMRWTFDMRKPDNRIEENVIGPPGDMPRVADKDLMADYDIGYYQTFDPTLEPLIVGPVGAGFNTVLRMEIKTGKITGYAPGPKCTVQEHVHIASKKPGHEGYLAFVVDKHDEYLSEVHVLEAAHPEKGALAKIKVPLRLRCGVHGSWVNAEDLRG
jgi:carotenoid cleavage dioxygenase-like enzyme